MTATVATTRQSRRRMIMKGAKLLRRQVSEMAARAELTSLRENRGPWSLPKKYPGKLMSSRRPYAKPHGEMNRSIIRDAEETIPAYTVWVNYHAAEHIPARTYDRMFHATKGPRSRRVYA